MLGANDSDLLHALLQRKVSPSQNSGLPRVCFEGQVVCMDGLGSVGDRIQNPGGIEYAAPYNTFAKPEACPDLSFALRGQRKHDDDQAVRGLTRVQTYLLPCKGVGQTENRRIR